MRILVLTSSNPGKDSTAEIHMKEVLRCLSETDQVIAIAQPEHRLRGISGLTVKEVRSPRSFAKITAVGIFCKILLAGSSIIAATIELSRSQIDVIYARHGINSLGAVVLSKTFRKPLVLEVNALWSDDVRYYARHYALVKMAITETLARLLDVLSFRYSDMIVAVTEGIKKAIVEEFSMPPSRVQVIPNGANTDLFKPTDQNAARLAVGLGKDDKIICFVGSIYYLTPWPGMSDLIAGAPRVLKKVSRAKFLIIGNGPLKNRWHLMVRGLNLQDAFIFAGRVPYDLVPTYINASDICVVPFRRMVNEQRGLSPLKLYEYLACGKPVVGSDIRGVGDLLKSSDAGMAVPPEDPEALGEAIVLLLNDEKTRARMANNARQIAVRNFSWRSTARRISSVCAKASRQTTQMTDDR